MTARRRQLFKTIATRTASDAVLDQFMARIRAGRIKPGDRIPSEPDLALSFGVGRSTVREAKRVLMARGLLESRGKAGTYLVEPDRPLPDPSLLTLMLSDKALIDLHEAREIVEVAAIRLAAQRATEKDLVELEAALAELEQAVASGNDDEVWPAGIRFHGRLVQASLNQALGSIYRLLSELIRSDQLPLYRTVAASADEVASHKRLLDAVASHDPVRAQREMSEHLEDSDHKAETAARPSAGRKRRTPSAAVAARGKHLIVGADQVATGHSRR